MTIIKIDNKAREFITKYEKLCRKYNMQIKFADEIGYYVDTDLFDSDISHQVDSLAHRFAKGGK